MKRLLILLILITSVCTAQHRRFPFPAATPYLNSTDFILWDEFSIAQSAGAVNGTYSESGALRTVTDTESKLSITGGGLSFSGGKASPAWGDPMIAYPSMARTAGRMIIDGILGTGTGEYIQIGYDGNTTGELSGGLSFVEGYIALAPNSTPVVGLDVDGTSYNAAVILRANGHYIFVKGGAFTNWSLLWMVETGLTGTPVYPRYANYSYAGTSSFLRIPRTLWLPTPLVSDGFAP